jgi:20S proteasome alpha/beta subunit
MGVGYHQRAGFHAIGTGSDLADAALVRTYERDLTVDEMIYRVCEAKFIGEAASGVGERTYIVTLDKTGAHRGVKFPKQVEPIRAAWNTHGKPPIPAEALEAIRSQVVSIEFRNKV